MYRIYLEILLCALSTRVSVLILTCGLQFQVLTVIDDSVYLDGGVGVWDIDECERLMYFGYTYVLYIIMFSEFMTYGFLYQLFSL